MQRRGFLRIASVALLPLLGGSARLLSPSSRNRTQRFHVAGVAFHDADVSRLSTETRLQLSASQVCGALCYEVLDNAGRRLGYIPRPLVALVRDNNVVSLTLREVRPHAVPWKQLEAEIVYRRRAV